MGEVVDLAERRERRREAVRDAAERAVTALRWSTRSAPDVAHRRVTMPLQGEPRGVRSRAACGADDALVLARPGARDCPDCYS